MLGWGRTIGGGKPANILQQAVMPVVDHQTCAEANKDLVPVDQQSMVCAGYATTGNVISGCQGDSGGPFVCEENGRFFLHGAVSWGDPRCEADSSYTVFARVSSYVDWIKHKMAIGGRLLFHLFILMTRLNKTYPPDLQTPVISCH